MAEIHNADIRECITQAFACIQTNRTKSQVFSPSSIEGVLLEK
ncbi:MAG TPA: hypothetical protein VJY54_00555 [Lachnospiraceae bacterium]|jgi:hypothetical protein|nr:hypothetical protein [Lachnospiraceae bacterium]